MTSSERTTARLTLKYNHQLTLSATLHTIITTLEGPDAGRLRQVLVQDPHVSQNDDNTLRHGPYMYISFGVRNMIFRLHDTGMAYEDILIGKQNAVEWFEETFPDRDYVNKGKV